MERVDGNRFRCLNFRIFNAGDSAAQFDPEGDFIVTGCPRFHLPTKQLHQPPNWISCFPSTDYPRRWSIWAKAAARAGDVF